MSDLPKIAMLDMGDHLLLETHVPGPCSECRAMRRAFASRGGRTLCITCDAAAEKRKRLFARLTFEEMQEPVIIGCTCPLSKDPEDLFKCTCDAFDPRNRLCMHDVPLSECTTCSAGVVNVECRAP